MHIKNAYSRLLISIALLVNTVSGFGLSLFAPGSIIKSGSSVSVIFSGAPNRVNVKLAVQNPDNSLTSIEPSTLFNVIPTTFTQISIPKDTAPGINYWLVAVDTSNDANYATLGPFSISEMFSDVNPSASITMNSGISYSTEGYSASSTISSTSTTPSGSSSKPTGPAVTSTPKASNPNESSSKSKPMDDGKDPQPSGGIQSSISLGAIIGIAAGGVAAIALMIITAYCCCFKKAVEALVPIVSAVKRPNNLNNDSTTIPMTLSPSFTNAPSSNTTTNQTTTCNASTIANNTQQTKIDTPILASPQVPSLSSPPSTTNHSTSDYTFNNNASTENIYNYQHTANLPPQQQQGYLSYPYPYNPNQQNMHYYPTHDLMPVPEYHYGDNSNNAYSQVSSTNCNYSSLYQQQQWGEGAQQSPSAQFNAGHYAYHPTAGKTEHDIGSDDDTALAQKVENNGTMLDNKAEYNQKPDTAVDDQPVYSKPNQRTL